MASNIRVSVHWRDSTVFAGEEVECTITFKNTTHPRHERSPAPPASRSIAHSERSRHTANSARGSARPSVSRNSSTYGPQAPSQQSKGHRHALSLYDASNASVSNTANAAPAAPQANGTAAPPNKHGRSLSIMSLGSNTAGDALQDRGVIASSRRSSRGHGRSASLQVVPGRKIGSPAIGSTGARSTTIGSPTEALASARFNPPGSAPLPLRSPRAPNDESRATSPGIETSGARGRSGSILQNFKFPMTSSPTDINAPQSGLKVVESSQISRMKTPPSRTISPRPPEEGASPSEAISPITRILSGSSMNGTPRSSGEFYSMSNNSTETLASEYVQHTHRSARLLPRIIHSRQSSQIRREPRQALPETLMMGYAQIAGSFTVDGSLINQAPFEEVKRKGVVGGQGGGGVVGVERTKRESGLFGALGWGNIGESLGGLLGAGEPSSIREMRGIASSKTVPLLSTPQSILFVDLRLAPGESKSFTYTFKLPRGLPPSHKGRVMKVNYHITIGTQRAGAAMGQQLVKKIDVPFRVIGSVTTYGEILGHDLMSPYVLLKDEAKTKALEPSNPLQKDKSKETPSREDAASESFLEYVDQLLDTPRQNSSAGLLSPTDPGNRRKSMLDEPRSMKEAIDLAILRSNTAAFSPQNTNKFEIARGGRHVAVILLARPAYRLGETISAVIDFSKADIPSYSVLVCLETSEKVDPAIALRSNSSIYRATRKVHASFAENALFARKLVFCPTVPPTATPEFITSGVSLEWKLRIEFTTPRLTGEDGEEEMLDELLEEVANDDRGIILAAMERLPCESFEVAVPIRVYGAVVGGADGQTVEGLAV